MLRNVEAVRASLFALVVVVGLMLCPVSISAAENVSCKTGFGTKVPVVLVHGLHSSQETWNEEGGSSTSMVGALEQIEGISLDYFDYSDHNSTWVTHPSISLALAKRINCLAEESRESGGAGKVIIVAHSMGGLATREAGRFVVDGHVVSKEIGLVVTLGTPHLGSGYGNLCDYTLSIDKRCHGTAPKALAEGSNQLEVLPQFADSTSVRAIAGHVTAHVPVLWGHIVRDLGGDKVVSIESATEEHTTPLPGDGKFIFKCRGSSLFPEPGDAPCEHGEMLKTHYIQKSVKQGIERYIASIRPSAVHNFYGLQLELQPGWKVTHEDEYSTTVRDMSNCVELPSEYEGYPEELGCAAVSFTKYDRSPPPGASMDGAYCEVDNDLGEISVAGRSAQYMESEDCSNGLLAVNGDMRTWRFETEKLLVDAYSPAGSPLVGFDEALKEATWVNN